MLKEIEIPEVKSIGVSAFMGCATLLEIRMPSVESIGHGAFNGCLLLRLVEMPELQKIGLDVFSQCGALETVLMPQEIRASMREALPEESAKAGCMPPSAVCADGGVAIESTISLFSDEIQDRDFQGEMFAESLEEIEPDLVEMDPRQGSKWLLWRKTILLAAVGCVFAYGAIVSLIRWLSSTEPHNAWIFGALGGVVMLVLVKCSLTHGARTLLYQRGESNEQAGECLATFPEFTRGNALGLACHTKGGCSLDKALTEATLDPDPESSVVHRV